MAKCFSKKYGNKGGAFTYLQSESYVKMPVSAWCYTPTSLPPEYILVGSIAGWGGIKMASTSTPSANDPANDLISVHTVQLKPMIKAQIWRMVSSGIDSDHV